MYFQQPEPLRESLYAVPQVEKCHFMLGIELLERDLEAFWVFQRLLCSFRELAQECFQWVDCMALMIFSTDWAQESDVIALLIDANVIQKFAIVLATFLAAEVFHLEPSEKSLILLLHEKSFFLKVFNYTL